jgi:hypothetical protein
MIAMDCVFLSLSFQEVGSSESRQAAQLPPPPLLARLQLTAISNNR